MIYLALWFLLSLIAAPLIGSYLRRVRREQTRAVDARYGINRHYQRSQLPPEKWVARKEAKN